MLLVIFKWQDSLIIKRIVYLQFYKDAFAIHETLEKRSKQCSFAKCSISFSNFCFINRDHCVHFDRRKWKNFEIFHVNCSFLRRDVMHLYDHCVFDLWIKLWSFEQTMREIVRRDVIWCTVQNSRLCSSFIVCAIIFHVSIKIVTRSRRRMFYSLRLNLLSQAAIQKQNCGITWCDYSHVMWLRWLCTERDNFDSDILTVYSLMKAWSAITCWSRHWILEFWIRSYSESFVSTSFRESYHFQLIIIILRACSLLVDWNSYHSRNKDESTLINLYSSSHRSEDENHSTTKKQTFETSNFATKRSIDSAR